MTDDDPIRPVPPLRVAVPLGPASGKPAGVQPSGEGPAPSTLAASVTTSLSVSRRGEPDRPKRDRHAVGRSPFSAALTELYKHRDKLKAELMRLQAAIETIEKLEDR